MGESVVWIEGRIFECQGGERLVPGQVGSSLQQLAGALSALEAGHGSVFGVHMNDEILEDRERLAARIRETLRAWEERLVTARRCSTRCGPG